MSPAEFRKLTSVYSTAFKQSPELQGYKAFNRVSLKKTFKQECIPVGCVPPAHYRGGGSFVRGVSLTETPLDRDSLDRDPPGQETSLDRDPHGQKPPWTETPWTETPQTEIPPLQTETPMVM